jgi:anaerobic selenocysteine-containing dehydrogenase
VSATGALSGDGTGVADETVVHHRTCPLCEATCGLEITARRTGPGGGPGPIVRVRGDREDVFSHGFICPKGSTVRQVHEDPDHLRRPLLREDGEGEPAGWRDATWDEAFAEVERRLRPIVEEHGRDAVAVYLGNPTTHNHGALLYVPALVRALGTTNVYSASTVDQMPKHLSAGLMFGNANTIPVPDLDRTDHLLLLGANPYESNGSLCTAPDFPGRLEAIRARGGRVVVVDPRRTKTAAHADEHVAIRPGHDAHLLAAMAHVLFAEDLVDVGALAPHLTGLDEVGALVRPFTPDAVAPVTGIEAGTIRRLARELAAAPTAAVYGRIGTHTVAFGTLASWAVDVLNVLTGNLDRPGGAMFPKAAHGPRAVRRPGRGFTVGRRHSRVKGYPEVKGELPVATLADEIETHGPGQVRALVVVGGNPALSTPDSGRLERALARLDLVVSVDIYRNETSRHAHVILPPPSLLERSHYDLAFTTLAVRNVAHWSPPLYDKGDRPDEAAILARLALIAGGAGAGADPAAIDDLLLDGVLAKAVRAGGPHEGRDPAELRALLRAATPADRVLEAMVRSGPYGDEFGLHPDGLTFDSLTAAPHGIDLGPLGPRVPELITTASGRVELAPALIAADVARLVASLGNGNGNGTGDGQGVGERGLLLIGRRDVRSNNSWMHNVEVLVKGRPRCTLQMHPDDATRLGVADGDPVTLRSRVGTVEAPVEITADILAGVVSLPHGWGHDRPGTGQSVAARHAGVNTNVLTDGAALDPLSGNAVLNGIPVTVVAAGA